MNEKKLSFMMGIFCLLNTIQFLIFEVNELAFIGYEDNFSIYRETNSELVSWVTTYKKNINVCLSTITLVVSSFFLYCIHNSNYVGLLCYTVWIITYELLSFSIVLLTNRTIKEQFRELRYLHLIFQVSRMLLHVFCLPFVTKYAYSLYKDPKTLSKIGRHRHSSVSTVDSWPPVGLGSLYRKLN
ncbi:putative transmembrane protein 217B [Hippopotamus amphibius kiboko]|uniref:putative transmembrane protein 217B n=1 Tax=Hippopotamus amphibius kiboko TaxID=575201 RepID=UPI0025918478|nr:putative transmembrane protein 217B [Hippopotamus amphibius kiboko]